MTIQVRLNTLMLLQDKGYLYPLKNRNRIITTSTANDHCKISSRVCAFKTASRTSCLSMVSPQITAGTGICL